jgi:hypothetical protein
MGEPAPSGPAGGCGLWFGDLGGWLTEACRPGPLTMNRQLMEPASRNTSGTSMLGPMASTEPCAKICPARRLVRWPVPVTRPALAAAWNPASSLPLAGAGIGPTGVRPARRPAGGSQLPPPSRRGSTCARLRGQPRRLSWRSQVLRPCAQPRLAAPRRQVRSGCCPAHTARRCRCDPVTSNPASGQAPSLRSR